MTQRPMNIAALVADAGPVRRLPAPMLRAAAWLAFAVAVLAAFVVRHGVEAETWARLSDPGFVLPALAAALAGILAAVAAFHISLPDRPLAWLLLPAPAALVWLSAVGLGCLIAWVDLPADPAERQHALDCFLAVTTVSLPLLASLLLVLRHAFALRPVPVALAAAFAVAGLGTSVLMFIHVHGTSLMILGWNLGFLFLTMGLARLAAGGLARLSRPKIA